jgi:hypothetical protein
MPPENRFSRNRSKAPDEIARRNDSAHGLRHPRSALEIVNQQKTWIASAAPVAALPIARFSPYDSTPRDVGVLTTRTAAAAVKAGGSRRSVRSRVIAAARRGTLRSASDLAALGLSLDDVRSLSGACLFRDDLRVAINDVQPATRRITSGRPFRLEVSFAAPVKCTGLLRIAVEWTGSPFFVERILSAKEMAKGKAGVAFNRQQTLPVGPATFHVSLYTDRGSQTSFRVTCAVLPSYPLSLSVSPRANFVTGSISARAVRQGSSFVTAFRVSLINGNARAVAMRNDFSWEFWDGSVESGTLVEQGRALLAGPINVPGYGVWSAAISMTSPPSSGAFKKLTGKKDLTLRISMTRASGSVVSGELAVRTMFRFGLNITRVGAEDFSEADYAKLYQAVDVARSIYERRDVTFDVNRRHIPNALVGEFSLISSANEAQELFKTWSGPENNFIDVFLVHSTAGANFDGYSAGVPGPTAHSGRRSGVVVDKSGLNVPFLGMLIAHEVGHYLGLDHISEAGNLMHPLSNSTDTYLKYRSQYRLLIQHGWVSID